MYQVLDAVVGLLAPHHCLLCGATGHVLCPACAETVGEPHEPCCAGCKKLSKNWKTCSSCKKWLVVDSVIVAAPYSSLYEALLHAYKYEFKRRAADSIAQLMCELVEKSFFNDATLVPIPTASARVRQRGFDNGRLLAQEVSRRLQLPLKPLLHRSTNNRQVGATRKQRLEQMRHEFVLVDIQAVAGKSFLLVDDVLTTGATVAAAAKVLKKAGAKQVSALIFAQKI
jgi:ComF family protein